MQTGLQLVYKWIERNRQLGVSDDEMDGTRFVYGDTLYTIKKTGNGEFDVDHISGKIIVFRDEKELDDEYTCRICGTEYTSKIDTIRCCMNQDE